MKEGKYVCRTNKFKDSDIYAFYFGGWAISILFSFILIYIIIRGLIYNESISFFQIMIIIILIISADFFCYFAIKTTEGPIITEEGLSVQYRTIIDKYTEENLTLRQEIPWSDITKMKLDSTDGKHWNCIFVHKTDVEIELSSQMGYSKECLTNLIKLGDELIQKSIDVNISKTALELAEEKV